MALLAAMALVMAACGSDSDSADSDPGESDNTDGSAEQLDYDPDGVLRISEDLGLDSSGNFDPREAFNGADNLRLFYDTFLQINPDGSFRGGLAESFELVDSQTIQLQLREGLEFSDGTALDAATAAEGLLANAALEEAPAFRGEYTSLSDIETDGELGLTLMFDDPVAGSYLALLAGQETMLVSPTADADGVDISMNPVGAGPFLIESYDEGVKAVLTKNPTYWDAENIKLGGIELINATSDATLTGFQAGQIDLIPGASQSEVDAVAGDDQSLSNTGSSGNAWNLVFLCKSSEEFESLEVRQALNYAIDRASLAELMGESSQPEEVVGSWASGSPFYSEQLAGSYSYDPDKARELLAEAGYGEDNPLEFGAFFTQSPFSQTMMEVLQQQFEDVGVSMDISLTNDVFNQFLVNAEEPAALIPMARQGTGKVTRIYGTGSPVNVCQYSNPELDQVMADLAAADQATPSQEAIDLWDRANTIVTEEALGLFIYFRNEHNIWNEKVGGVEDSLIPNYESGSLEPDFFKLFITA